MASPRCAGVSRTSAALARQAPRYPAAFVEMAGSPSSSSSNRAMSSRSDTLCRWTVTRAVTGTPLRCRVFTPRTAPANAPAPRKTSCAAGLDPSTETWTWSHRPVRAMNAAIRSSISPPFERIEKRIRLRTIAARSSGRSSRMKGSPPATTTFITPARPHSSKKPTQAAVGRSRYCREASSKK